MTEPTFIVRGEKAIRIAAAAPDLLEALQGLCRSHRAQLHPSEFAAARAAITKATPEDRP